MTTKNIFPDYIADILKAPVKCKARVLMHLFLKLPQWFPFCINTMGLIFFGRESWETMIINRFLQSCDHTDEVFYNYVDKLFASNNEEDKATFIAFCIIEGWCFDEYSNDYLVTKAYQKINRLT